MEYMKMFHRIFRTHQTQRFSDPKGTYPTLRQCIKIYTNAKVHNTNACFYIFGWRIVICCVRSAYGYDTLTHTTT